MAKQTLQHMAHHVGKARSDLATGNLAKVRTGKKSRPGHFLKVRLLTRRTIPFQHVRHLGKCHAEVGPNHAWTKHLKDQTKAHVGHKAIV